ncbi:ABC transporter substrate-binding protein [Natronorubrum halophilum]|uniref:ABC transporter substrate-binding protein n=1 Tax=Natronorubrum halophilum TaxID=1702106 RepID=UPI001EE93A67|nr:ABC transporter substrate-binding protein [Natronorubrum halophilum]
MNWNTWAPSYPWTPTWLLLEPVQRFYADGTMSLELVEDWEYDPDSQELTVHHNEDFYWWNGDVANAADKYWYGEVARLLSPDSSRFEALHLENNGKTIVREFKDPQNPEMVQYDLGGYLGEMMRSHRDKFRPWAEELEDATTDEERLEIEERMADEMPIDMDTFIEEGLGLGPFQAVEYDDQGIYCELFDQHPYADQIEIDNLDYMLASGDAIAQQMIGGDLDFGFAPLANWIGEQEPNHLETVAPYEDTFMRKLEFMMDGPGSDHTRRLEFRRAVAHLINLQHVSDNFAPPSTPRTRQTGLPEAVTQEWLGDYTDDFLEYPTESDEEGAADLLRSAGYEQDGDAWVDGNGNAVSLELVTANWADNPARTVTDQLSNFGFEVDLTVLEGAAYNDRTEDHVGFDMTMGNHGALVAHPLYYFRPTHKHGNDLGTEDVIEDSLANGDARSPYNGKELIVEIPEEVGQEDLSGSTQEINLYELFQEWMTAQSEERSQEIARTFTWFWNFYMPGIDQFGMMSGSWGNVQNWEFNANKDWEAYRGAFRGVKRGHISPK